MSTALSFTEHFQSVLEAARPHWREVGVVPQDYRAHGRMLFGQRTSVHVELSYLPETPPVLTLHAKLAEDIPHTADSLRAILNDLNSHPRCSHVVPDAECACVTVVMMTPCPTSPHDTYSCVTFVFCDFEYLLKNERLAAALVVTGGRICGRPWSDDDTYGPSMFQEED